MPDQHFKRLIYKGNFAFTRAINFGAALLSAAYPGGYREDVIVGDTRGLRSWKLTYSALHRHVMVGIENGQEISRPDYIGNFFAWSKAGGNLPFIITDPHDGKDYLVIFKDDELSYEMANHFLSTTGLQLEQVYVRGVNFLDDGSLGENTNDATI